MDDYDYGIFVAGDVWKVWKTGWREVSGNTHQRHGMQF